MTGKESVSRVKFGDPLSYACVTHYRMDEWFGAELKIRGVELLRLDKDGLGCTSFGPVRLIGTSLSLYNIRCYYLNLYTYHNKPEHRSFVPRIC